MPMPAAKGKKTAHYGVNTPAGTNGPNNSVRPLADNPRRTMLLIQNVGLNDGLCRFGEPVQGDGTDMLFSVGSGLLWDREATCPEAAINLGSENGTTWAILEQVQG